MSTAQETNGTNGAPKGAGKVDANADLAAQLEALKAENAALRAARDQGIRVDVNKSGNVRMRVEGASYALPPKHARAFLDSAKLIRDAIVKAESGER